MANQTYSTIGKLAMSMTGRLRQTMASRRSAMEQGIATVWVVVHPNRGSAAETAINYTLRKL